MGLKPMRQERRYLFKTCLTNLNQAMVCAVPGRRGEVRGIAANEPGLDLPRQV
jgi:hypothetical protein